MWEKGQVISPQRFQHKGSYSPNHSLECSLSYSPDLSICRSIWMQQNFWLAKPYGLASQKLCYIPISESRRKKTKNVLGNGWWIWTRDPCSPTIFNPLPHMLILGYSNSAGNNLMSKILTNGNTIFWLSWKHRNCSLRAISSQNVVE